MNHRSTEPFDSWLEAELDRLLSETLATAAPSEARYAQERRTERAGARPALAGLTAAAGANLAVGATAVVLAAGTGGAIAETVVTGSASPVVWTEQVVGAMASCGPDLGDGSVGSCAREFSKPPASQRVPVQIPIIGVTPTASPLSPLGPFAPGASSPTAAANSSPSPGRSATPNTGATGSPVTAQPPTSTPQRSPSPTASRTPTATPTRTPTPSPSPSATHTPTPTPSSTHTPTHVPTQKPIQLPTH